MDPKKSGLGHTRLRSGHYKQLCTQVLTTNGSGSCT